MMMIMMIWFDLRISGVRQGREQTWTGKHAEIPRNIPSYSEIRGNCEISGDSETRTKGVKGPRTRRRTPNV